MSGHDNVTFSQISYVNINIFTGFDSNLQYPFGERMIEKKQLGKMQL